MEENQRHQHPISSSPWNDDEHAVNSAPHLAPSPKGGGWRPPRWLPVSLLIMLGLLLVVYAYLHDDPPPWDNDLITISEAPQNKDISAPLRMKTMLQAAGKIKLSQLSSKPPWEWDTPMLAQALESHSAVLDNFRDLLEEKETEWMPECRVWKMEDFGAHPEWTQIILLKQAEVAYLARRDQEEAAFIAALDMAVLGHLLERLDAWPSFMRRAFDLHESSAQSLAMLLKNTRLSEERLRRLQNEEFKPWGPSDASLGRSMRGYYAYEKKLIMGPQPGEPPLPPGYVPARSGWLLFKPNATLRLFADSFRELKDEAAISSISRVDQIDSRIQRHRASGSGALGGPNKSGDEYFRTRIRPYLDLLDEHGLAKARYAVVTALFGVRRYIAKEARIPQKLEDLVPTYLTAVPVDPFSNEPLHYDAKQGLIYSVGTNLMDEGGKPTPLPMDDPTEVTVSTGIGTAKAAK